MADKLDKLLARMADPKKREADRLAKMARVKPPRMQGSMAGDVTTGLGRTREDMENIARGLGMPRPSSGKVPKGRKANKMKTYEYGGKVEKMEYGGEAGGSCRGGGCAVGGTKFRGVK